MRDGAAAGFSRRRSDTDAKFILLDLILLITGVVTGFVLRKVVIESV